MEKRDVKDRKIVNFIIKIFWIFVIGSVFGFFAEMLYALVYTRTFQIRQGLIYGPFIQVYGMGAIAYYALISKVKEPKEAFIYGIKRVEETRDTLLCNMIIQNSINLKI